MNIQEIKLSKGSHKGQNDGACIMELVSYLAKEPWSDHPACASESVTAFAIWINDSGDQSHRDQLLELAPKIVNTRDWKKEAKRASIFADYALWCAKETGFAQYAAQYAQSAAKSAQYPEFRVRLYDKAIETLKAVLEV